MPKFEDGSYSSTAGRALIAKVLAGGAKCTIRGQPSAKALSRRV